MREVAPWEMAPQLNSKAGPVESVSTGVPSVVAENVELVMVQVYRNRIVDLVGWPLRR